MGASILIADDEEGIREVLRWELSNRGHDVVVARNGTEAVAEVQKAEFDLVISDVRMPGLNGIEVLQATKEASPDTEVVIATGYADIESAVECVRGGAFDFVQKPFDINDLMSVVARALERRELRANSALYHASQAVFGNTVRQQLPETIVAVAVKIMNADDVCLMLPDGERRLYVAYSHGMDGEAAANARLALVEGIVGKVAVPRDPVLLVDGQGESSAAADAKNPARARSSIVYPLVASDGLVGVLNINRVTNTRRFRKHDLERASVVASQTLLALENARLVRQLVTSERLASVGQLAAGVAHEINNPLTYVLASHSLLREQMLMWRDIGALVESGADISALRAAWEQAGGRAFLDEVDHIIQDVGEGTTKIRDIVRDLKSLARNDQSQPVLFDLNDPIRSALRVAGAELRHRARVVMRLGPHAEILGSAGRLSQVFVNLLVNAAQAFGDNSVERNEVVVTSERDGDNVVASVSDNGSGIAPEHLSRMFETFFTTKGPTIGTGLGLSISREIVRSHGGEIRVASTPGQGATFTIVLPYAGGRGATIARSKDSSAPPRPVQEKKPKSCILFIDDQQAILRSYQRAFSRDHEVVAAEGGAEALRILAQRTDFDLIVCDLLMPGVSGMDVYKRVREAHRHLDGAFVFVTGGVTQTDVHAFLGTISNQVLEKPFEFAVLRKVIDARMRKKEENRK